MSLRMKRRAFVTLSAVAIPLASVAVDLAVRAELVRSVVEYTAGVALSVAIWAFAMEAARDRRRAVRGAAFVLLAFVAIGMGLQAVARTFVHAYVGRRALLLAMGFE